MADWPVTRTQNSTIHHTHTHTHTHIHIPKGKPEMTWAMQPLLSEWRHLQKFLTLYWHRYRLLVSYTCSFSDICWQTQIVWPMTQPAAARVSPDPPTKF